MLLRWLGALFLASSCAWGAAPAGSALIVPPTAPRPSGFQRLEPSATGLNFTHVIPPGRSLTNQMLLDGSGVALADVDGDGRVDVFLAATGGGSQLWRNQGNWRFEPITSTGFATSTNALGGDVTGAAFADLNGDGTPDLVLNTHTEGVRVLLNDGKGGFRPMSFTQVPARGGHSLALADVDGDGWVDLYVCNYRRRALMDMPSARATFQGTGANKRVATLDGRPTTDPDLTNRFIVTASGGLEELGEPDVLYRNLGGTNLVAVFWTEGAFLGADGQSLTDAPRDWGLAAQFCDVNDDGRPDLYVCNDFASPDRLWLNEGTPGQVRFRLAPASLIRHTSLFSMGVDFGDVNRDGRWDAAVVDMLSPDHVRRLTTLDGTPSVSINGADPFARPQNDANSFLLQRPDGSFAEVAGYMGLLATDWSWTPAFLDVDLDGWPDLLITAGQERGSRDLDIAEHMKNFRRAGLRTDAQIFRERQKFPAQRSPLKAFRNRGSTASDGIPVFEDTGSSWGFDFIGVSHGLALGDLDGDGDLDVVVNHLNQPAGLYRNDATGPRVLVRLRGRTPNTGAIGARIRFWWQPEETGKSPALPQTAQVFAGGRYLSGEDFGKTFACPGPGRGRLEVRWPDGKLSTEEGLVAGRQYILEEAGEGAVASVAAPKSRLRFEARPTDLTSAASTCDDFTLQPLLPRRQSTRLPALAISPANTSNPTLWLGGGPGQTLRRIPVRGISSAKSASAGPARAQSAVIAWGDGAVVAEAAWQGTGAGKASVLQLTGDSAAPTGIPTRVTAPACLAVSTASPTNAAWLFIGGGALPGRYPRSSESEWLQFDGKGFQSVVITNLGLVSAARFVDIDGDGAPELLVATEWGSPRIFRGKNGGWEGWDAVVEFVGAPRMPLGQLTGWWQSLATGDFDQDGRPDIVLGNWGLNSAYALYTDHPVQPTGTIRPLSIVHGTLGEGGPLACIEGYTGADGVARPLHGLTELGAQIPGFSGRYPTHRSFAEATLDAIAGPELADPRRLECRWLSSLILLNRGDHFEARALPDAAQLGPVMSMALADFDGDGRPDLYAAQGFFGHNFGAIRDDAGEGVFLLGRGDGGFDAVPSSVTGARVLGEQRSTEAADVDGDGRPDVIVGIHGGPVTVLLNRRP